MPWYQKAMLYFAQSTSNGQVDAYSIISDYNEEAKENAIKRDEKTRDEYLAEEKKIYEEIADIAKEFDLGNHNSSGQGTFDKEAALNKMADAELKARQKIEDMTIALMKESEAKEKALSRKKFDDEMARINQEERERLKALQVNKKNGLKVTPEQVSVVTDQAKMQRDKASEQYIKEFYAVEKEYSEKLKQLNLEEAQSWVDYNKEYGTYREKRLAIEQDYILKMSKISISGGKASLRKEMEKSLKELDLEAFKDSINFADVFGNLETLSTNALTKLRGKLKEYIDRAAGDLKPSDLKPLTEALTNIDMTVAGKNPFAGLKSGLEEYKTAQEEVEKAQQELNQVMKTGSLLVEEYNEETGEITRKLLTQADAEKNLTDAQKKKLEAQNKLTQSVNSIGEKGQQVVTAGNDLCDMLTNLGISIPESIQGTLEGLGQVMNSLASVDFTKPFSVLTGVTGTLAGIGKTIGSIFGLGSGADYSDYDRMVAKYDALMDVWDQLLNKKKAYIKESYSTEAVKAGEEALGLLDAEKEVNKRLAESRLSSGSSAGSHSLWYRMWKGSYKYEGQNWRDVAGDVSKSLGGVKFDSMNDMLDMTGEQLEWIKTQYSGLWSVMDGDFRQYLDNIIEYGEVEKEIIASVKEQVTGISLDGFEDSYLSMMTNLDSTNEDFADNLEKYLQTSIFRSLIAEKYKGQIQSLYDSFYEYGKDGLTQNEVESLRKQQQELADAMLAERDNMMKVFGWSSDNSAASSSQFGRTGAVTTITEETGGKIEGSLNIVVDHLSGMDDKLTDISKNSYDAIGALNKIAENSEYLKRLDDVVDELEKQNRDGIKLKS